MSETYQDWVANQNRMATMSNVDVQRMMDNQVLGSRNLSLAEQIAADLMRYANYRPPSPPVPTTWSDWSALMSAEPVCNP